MSERGPWFYERRWPEIAEYLERDDVALLPVGSTEQHGPHLPVATDAAEAIAVALGAAQKAGVLVAPPVWYGWTPHHMAYPGTITLRPETLTAIVEDVCQSLIHQGFRRIIVINGHRIANLPPIEIAIAKIRNRTGGYVALYDLALSARIEMREIVSGDLGAVGHACEDETSQMLHSYSHLVEISQARRAVHVTNSRYMFGGFNTPDPAQVDVNFVYRPSTVEEFGEHSRQYAGVAGDPTKASAEKGQQIFDAQVANICQLIDLCRGHEVKIKDFTIPI
ncbi:MAG: creatininase [Candidatus Dormiibacter spiritus]|nr:MAG: creatininase [Candidatus Dormibacteraeota bacterium]